MLIKSSAIFAAGLFLLSAVSSAQAQSRDFLTEQEVEVVRDVQEIDDRIDVLIYAADRRFAALKLDVGGKAPVPGKKSDEEKWGKVPSGERIELLFDIRRILQKAIDDLNNISERPDSAILPHPDDKNSKKPKTLEELFPKALRSLAAAAARFKPALQKELDATTDQKQTGVILASIEHCDAIIESVAKLPAK